MKGGIAAFAAACAEVADHPGTLSLIITGDEEGPATYGTPAIMDWMAERSIKPGPDPDRRADVRGAARRYRQDRPAGLGQYVGDGAGRAGPCRLPAPRRQSDPRPRQGDRRARPRSISTTAAMPSSRPTSKSPRSRRRSRATNVIPGWARAQLNIRFNNLQRGADLVALVRRTAEAAAPGATVEAKNLRRGLPQPRPARSTPSSAPRSRRRPEQSPNSPPHGGTSDGRFLNALCPGGRFRPAQRHHAQARRGGGGRRHPRPRAYLRAGHSLSASA